MTGKASRKLPRSPSSGQFEPSSPLNDAALLAYVDVVCAAVDTLLPTLSALAQVEDASYRRGMLSAIRALVLLRAVYSRAVVTGGPSIDLVSHADLEALVQSALADAADVICSATLPTRDHLGLLLGGVQ
jgi:hypothetical protein